MGTQTFGKGSVQTILPLGNNTAIKLTTARYFTPNGQSIQAKGITPDVLDESAKDESERLREADLDRHLSNGKPDEVKKPAAEAATAAPKPAVKKPKPEGEQDQTKKRETPPEFGSSEDLLLTQALNYFKSHPSAPKKSAVQAAN
jgi:carboxyl-terminal processing protease